MSPRRPFLHEVMESLTHQVSQIDTSDPVAALFAAWLGFGTDSDWQQLARKQGSEAKESLIVYRHVAALGFLASLDAKTHEERFREGVHRLQGRTFFAPGRPPQFEVDALAILGVAVGLKSHELESNWLTELIRMSLRRLQESWSRSLLRATEQILGEETRQVEIEADLQAALASKGLMSPSEETCQEALQLGMSLGPAPPERAAVRWAALRWLAGQEARLDFRAKSIEDVCHILRAVPHALKRWPWEDEPKTKKSKAQQWSLENEYHVQSLLWALLAPIYEDLEDEEYLQSLGFRHPRADLVIPSLKLIVEVKYIRGGKPSDFSKVTAQVAEDVGLYLHKDSPFKSIAVFAWDDTASTQLHQEFRSGVLKLQNVVEAVVVPRPGTWTVKEKTIRAAGTK